jgi:hypothetical protein
VAYELVQEKHEDEQSKDERRAPAHARILDRASLRVKTTRDRTWSSSDMEQEVKG